MHEYSTLSTWISLLALTLILLLLAFASSLLLLFPPLLLLTVPVAFLLPLKWLRRRADARRTRIQQDWETAAAIMQDRQMQKYHIHVAHGVLKSAMVFFPERTRNEIIGSLCMDVFRLWPREVTRYWIHEAQKAQQACAAHNATPRPSSITADVDPHYLYNVCREAILSVLFRPSMQAIPSVVVGYENNREADTKEAKSGIQQMSALIEEAFALRCRRAWGYQGQGLRKDEKKDKDMDKEVLRMAVRVYATACTEYMLDPYNINKQRNTQADMDDAAADTADVTNSAAAANDDPLISALLHYTPALTSYPSIQNMVHSYIQDGPDAAKFFFSSRSYSLSTSILRWYHDLAVQAVPQAVAETLQQEMADMEVRFTRSVQLEKILESKRNGLADQFKDFTGAILNQRIMADLLQELPYRWRNNVHNLKVRRIFTTQIDGTSSHTFFDKAKKAQATILVIKEKDVVVRKRSKDDDGKWQRAAHADRTDDDVSATDDEAGDSHITFPGHLVGCFVTSTWKSQDRKYYGNGESFVFRVKDDQTVSIYRWTQKNNYFQISGSEYLAVGGGSEDNENNSKMDGGGVDGMKSFAIWLGPDFHRGSSRKCQTFNNPSLTRREEFECHVVELYELIQ